MNARELVARLRLVLADLDQGWRSTPRDEIGRIVAELEVLTLENDTRAAALEREACAKYVEEGGGGWAGRDFRQQLADAIRRREE